MFKISEYNIIWPLEDSDNAIIFNSFTAAVMEIKKSQLDLLKENSEIELASLDEEKKKTALELVKNRFLIEDFVDEKKVLKYRNASGKYSKEILSLTILPTFDCNLKCFYCFQERSTVDVMTPDIEEAIVQFVLKSIKGVKHLKVCWFGGEPLLAWDTICRLSDKLMGIAKENGCEYNASMVSNGYLFDDIKIIKLKELKVKTIQITLDGPPTLHSLRKGLEGNAQVNFEKILNIIKNLQKNQVNVSIRVNIDKSNKNYMKELLDILADSSLGDINIYPAPVTSYSEVCSNVADACLRTDEFLEVETHFYKYLLEIGLQSDLSRAYPRLKGNYCCTDQVNSFTIGPNGYVYKCWNTVGNKNEMVSDVMNRDWNESEKNEMRMRHISWITWNPFEIKECSECKVLPICMGGCPYKYKAVNKNNPDCMTMKDKLKEIVLNHYYCMKIKNILQ